MGREEEGGEEVVEKEGAEGGGDKGKGRTRFEIDYGFETVRDNWGGVCVATRDGHTGISCWRVGRGG